MQFHIKYPWLTKNIFTAFRQQLKCFNHEWQMPIAHSVFKQTDLNVSAQQLQQHAMEICCKMIQISYQWTREANHWGRWKCGSGKCRSGQYGSENVWKTVRTENKNSHQITDSTHPISKERLKLELSNLVHMEAISSLTKRIKNHPKRGVVMVMWPIKIFISPKRWGQQPIWKAKNPIISAFDRPVSRKFGMVMCLDITQYHVDI